MRQPPVGEPTELFARAVRAARLTLAAAERRRRNEYVLGYKRRAARRAHDADRLTILGQSHWRPADGA